MIVVFVCRWCLAVDEGSNILCVNYWLNGNSLLRLPRRLSSIQWRAGILCSHTTQDPLSAHIMRFARLHSIAFVDASYRSYHSSWILWWIDVRAMIRTSRAQQLLSKLDHAERLGWRSFDVMANRIKNQGEWAFGEVAYILRKASS